LAAAYGQIATVKELLAKKAESNAKDFDGKTPLDLALANNHLDIVKLIDPASSEMSNYESDPR
jgi:ankyrin repeat protein